MLCRAATFLLLQAFQELAHHRMRVWLQQASGDTARKIQQSRATSGTCPNHTRQLPLKLNFLHIRSSLPWLVKMNKHQSSMISHQLSLAQNTSCICQLETNNLQVQGLSKSAMVKTFNFSASEVWGHLYGDVLKCLLWTLCFRFKEHKTKKKGRKPQCLSSIFMVPTKLAFLQIVCTPRQPSCQALGTLWHHAGHSKQFAGDANGQLSGEFMELFFTRAAAALVCRGRETCYF